MKKKAWRFPVLMILSMLSACPCLLFKMGLDGLSGPDPGKEGVLVWEEGTISGQDVRLGWEAPQKQASQSQVQKPEEPAANGATLKSDSQAPGGGQEPGSQRPDAGACAESEEEFFSNALFIGDSRSVGLLEYAGLEGADFFASSGMNVFCLWEKEISVPGVGKHTLEELLKQKSYDTIFLMTGINELGYERAGIVKRYTETVQEIGGLQPQAALYLCANLHVTKERSQEDAIYNNENIDWLNGEIEALAGRGYGTYLDVNPLFDDEEGALRADYSGDDTHPYGKYYQEWGRWLYESCRRPQDLYRENKTD